MVRSLWLVFVCLAVNEIFGQDVEVFIDSGYNFSSNYFIDCRTGCNFNLTAESHLASIQLQYRYPPLICYTFCCL